MELSMEFAHGNERRESAARVGAVEEGASGVWKMMRRWITAFFGILGLVGVLAISAARPSAAANASVIASGTCSHTASVSIAAGESLRGPGFRAAFTTSRARRALSLRKMVPRTSPRRSARGDVRLRLHEPPRYGGPGRRDRRDRPRRLSPSTATASPTPTQTPCGTNVISAALFGSNQVRQSRRPGYGSVRLTLDASAGTITGLWALQRPHLQ
jgi:hypothetical protein